MDRIHIPTNSNSALVLAGSAPTLQIDQCDFRNDRGLASLIILAGSSGMLVATNSVFQDIALGEATGFTTAFVLAFNTFIIRQTTDTGNNSVVNCDFGSTPVSTRLENNVLQGHSLDAINGGGCVVNHNVLFPQLATIPGSNIVADPLVVDESSGDFHLKVGSPAIDLAVPSVDLTTDHDFEGRSRQTPFEIGAFEFQP